MWRKRLLFAIILLGISFCCPMDKTIHQVQAASSDFDCTAVSEIPQTECEALVALYNSTDGPNWTDSRDWLTTATPCDWYGVKCSGGFVTRLDFFDDDYLHGNNLIGALPAEIGNLSNLWSILTLISTI